MRRHRHPPGIRILKHPEEGREPEKVRVAIFVVVLTAIFVTVMTGTVLQQALMSYLRQSRGCGRAAMQETARPVREGDLGEGAEATAAAAATGGQVAAPGDGERSKGHERRPLKHFGLDHVQAVIQFAVLSRALGFRLSGRHVDQVAGLFVLRSDELLRGDAFEIADVQILLAIKDRGRVLVLVGQDGTRQSVQVGVVQCVLGGHGRFQLQNVAVGVAVRETVAATGTILSTRISVPTVPTSEHEQEQQKNGKSKNASIRATSGFVHVIPHVLYCSEGNPRIAVI